MFYYLHNTLFQFQLELRDAEIAVARANLDIKVGRRSKIPK